MYTGIPLIDRNLTVAGFNREALSTEKHVKRAITWHQFADQLLQKAFHAFLSSSIFAQHFFLYFGFVQYRVKNVKSLCIPQKVEYFHVKTFRLSNRNFFLSSAPTNGRLLRLMLANYGSQFLKQPKIIQMELRWREN